MIKLILIIFLIPQLLVAQNALAEEKHSQELKMVRQLDKKTSQLFNKIYRNLAKSSTQPVAKISSLENFLESNNFHNPKNLVSLHKHLNAIFETLEPFSTSRVIQILLEANDFETAEKLLSVVLDSGDSLLQAQAAIQFGEYYNLRNEPEKTLKILNLNLEDLSKEELSQASTIRGFALQNSKQHRRSLAEYNKVTEASMFYDTAQLNTAVAYIRQDWWTDAHITIRNRLTSKKTMTDELKNRLYLMLGYSLLSKEFFRESREAFRNIDLDNIYTNKALMGLALTALSQGDHTQALKLLLILNKKEQSDLVIDESYILLPHLYEKIEQYSAANAAYINAITHYEERISQLNIVTPAEIYNNFKQINTTKDIQSLGSVNFRLADFYPDYFKENILHLRRLQKLVEQESLKQQIDSLLLEYQSLYLAGTKQLIKNRIQALNSYLSQSNYGLAQLYDSENE